MMREGDYETAYSVDGAGMVNLEMRHLPTGLRASGSAKYHDEAKGIARERLDLMIMANNTGHGHVYPRADGTKARCGGPALCSECKADFERKGQEMTTPSTGNADKDNDPHMQAYSTTVMSDTSGFDQGVNHYTITLECTCKWTCTITNTFPRTIFDNNEHFQAMMSAAKDGLSLAHVVHRESKGL